MGRINELPIYERPREKALRFGFDQLSDAELLAIIIGSGYHGESAKEVAENLITSYNGIVELSKTPLSSLKKIKGIKELKALEIATVFELHKRLSIKENEAELEAVDSDFLYKKYRHVLKNERQEVLALVLVNRKNSIIFERTLYRGTEDDVIFSYKEIWRELLIHQAKGFYLIHNHPSQDAIPSVKDKIFTDELFLQGEKMLTPMLDHIIIGENSYYSFKKMKICYISC